MRRWSSGRLGPSLLILGVVLGCEDDPPPAAEAQAEVPREEKPAVDEKIASAMAAAEASARAEASPASGQAAPPPDGILGTEAAARELAPGSPAQLVLGSDGSVPRVRLGGEGLAPGAAPAGKLVLSYRSGGSVMPTIELDLTSKVTLDGATLPASAPTEPGPSRPLTLQLALGNVRPSDNQPGRLPENARAEIAKLSGSSIELQLQPDGALMEQRQRLAGNNPDLEPLVAGSLEALATALLPYPDVPVGVGAFWMVKSREVVNGAKVIAYRMVKVAELKPELAKLNVSTRRYLIEPTLPMAGLPAHRVRRFESQGEATISIAPGSAFPKRAEVQDGVMALVTTDERPNQALPIQTELSATLTFGR